jgi:hypothetical protein
VVSTQSQQLLREGLGLGHADGVGTCLGRSQKGLWHLLCLEVKGTADLGQHISSAGLEDRTPRLFTVTQSFLVPDVMACHEGLSPGRGVRCVTTPQSAGFLQTERRGQADRGRGHARRRRRGQACGAGAGGEGQGGQKWPGSQGESSRSHERRSEACGLEGRLELCSMACMGSKVGLFQ